MSKVTYDFFTDAGHGWLKVHMSTLEINGIDDQISKYSYRRGRYAYLEEDCDAPLLIKTLEANGVIVKSREFNTDRNSRIRSYRPYYI